MQDMRRSRTTKGVGMFQAPTICTKLTRKYEYPPGGITADVGTSHNAKNPQISTLNF